MLRYVALSVCAATAGYCADLKLGKPLTLPGAVRVSQLMSNPDSRVGTTVQVEGTVTEVCQKMGCWMALAEGGKIIRVKVNDGEIVFPKEAVGRRARAEGKLVKMELTREQAVARARHEAEEQGRTFDAASIRSGTTVYQIAGTGAMLLD